MKVSNKILVKSLFITILLAFITGGIIIGISLGMEYYNYKDCISETSKEEIIEAYQSYLEHEIYYLDFSDDNVSYEDFRAKYVDYYLYRAEDSLFNFKMLLALEIVTIIAFIPISILIIKYFKRTGKLIRRIKEYSGYMLATNSYKIENIAKEFNEEPRIVETTIQKAINNHILTNVYLSKQTKEILLVNKTSSAESTKGNQQNVNVENNETVVKSKKISKVKIVIFLILFVILVVGVIIGIRYYKIKDYVGLWSGSHLEQQSDGTSGLVPSRRLEMYDVNISSDGSIKIHEYWAYLEQKTKNGLYTTTLSNETDISGKLVIRKGKVYFKVEIGGSRSGLKYGDITELEWINYNKINMILPDHEVSLTK